MGEKAKLGKQEGIHVATSANADADAKGDICLQLACDFPLGMLPSVLHSGCIVRLLHLEPVSLALV